MSNLITSPFEYSYKNCGNSTFADKNRSKGAYGYKIIEGNLKKNGITFYNGGNGKDLITLLVELGAGAQDFLFKNYIDASGGLFWWTIKDSPGIRQRPKGMLAETFKQNIAKWNAKMWPSNHPHQKQTNQAL